MNVRPFKGCYTALVTPMIKERSSPGSGFSTGPQMDYEGLEKLVNFQAENGVGGILAVGTSGESPTLSWEDHIKVIEAISHWNRKRSITIAGVGSNSTEETKTTMTHIRGMGLDVEAILLVDPYYNGPSSLEIAKEYVRPIAEEFREYQVIPYVIPGRTGTKLLPHDLALLHHEKDLGNVNAVKEATGDLDNMKLTRKFCGKDFDILSGDDDMTLKMMKDPEICASGVISVTSNVAPKAVSEMCHYALKGINDKATALENALKPLFEIVTVKTDEETPYGTRQVKARNPLPYKTLMNILGMPAGPCRRPLGKMTKSSFMKVLEAARKVHKNNPEIFEPVERFFDLDVGERLSDERKGDWKALFYE